MNELKFTGFQESTTLDSRDVADMLSKRHSDLIRDIEQYEEYFYQNADLRFDDFFIKSSYLAGTVKSYKNYQITKKGCEFLAHKLTYQRSPKKYLFLYKKIFSKKNTWLLDVQSI